MIKPGKERNVIIRSVIIAALSLVTLGYIFKNTKKDELVNTLEGLFAKMQ